MIGPLKNAMRLQALRTQAGREVVRVGIVAGYDPNTYSATVTLLPDQITTGWLPIASPWIGNQWGLFCPPNVGDMVSVAFFEGHLEAGFVELRFWNAVDQALAPPSGEFWIVHKSGSLLKFTNDGKVALTSNSDLNVTVGGKLNANVTGDLNATVSGNAAANATGNVSVTSSGSSSVTVTSGSGGINLNGVTIDTSGNVNSPATITAATDVVGGGKHLKTHTHSGVTVGSGATGPPV